MTRGDKITIIAGAAFFAALGIFAVVSSQDGSAATPGPTGAAFGVLVLWLLGIVAYFIPAIVGRKKRNAGAILALNFFAGWTFIGWVVALVWALTKDEKIIQPTP